MKKIGKGELYFKLVLFFHPKCHQFEIVVPMQLVIVYNRIHEQVNLH